MSDLFDQLLRVAEEMKDRGAPLSETVAALVGDGATRLDLVRVIKRVEGVGVGEAETLLNNTGVVPVKYFTVTIEENDPFYSQIFGEPTKPSDR